MFGALLRIIFAFVVLAGLALLFFYAFVVALIVTPIVFILLYFFGRKTNLQWTVVRPGDVGHRPPGQGPVIDHDPNDLPRSS